MLGKHRRKRATAAIISAAVVGPLPAFAADRYFVGPTGSNWSTASNWNTVEGGGGSAGVPVATDNPYIRGNVTKTINFDGNYPTVFNSLNQLDIDSTGGATLTLNQAANSLIANSEYVGFNGNGAFTQSGGFHTVNSFLQLGANAGSNGDYALSGIGTLATPEFDIGRGGNGTYTQTGGSATFSGGAGVRIGVFAGSSGTATISGGTLTTNEGYVGGYAGAAGGTGVLNINTGGTMTVTGAMKVWNTGASSPNGTRVNLDGGTLSVGTLDLPNNGRFNFASGTLNLTGAGTSSVGGFSITGPSGPATVNQSNGTLNASISLYSANASYSLSGGNVSGSTSTINNQATFTHSGGTHTTTVQLGMDNGIYNLSGTGVVTTAGLEMYSASIFSQTGGTLNAVYAHIGHGNGASYFLSGGTLAVSSSGIAEIIDNFTHTGGSHTVAGSTIVGPGNSPGSYSLTGTGSLSVGETLTVAESGNAAFAQSGGTNSANTLYVARNSSSTGQYTLQGGSLTVAGSQVIGYDGAGIFTHSAGTNLITGGNNFYLGFGAGGTGIYNLSNTGALSVSGTQVIGYGGSGAFTQSGGTNSAGTLIVAEQAGSTGHYTLEGGSLAAGVELIGKSGSGIVTHSAGTNTTPDLRVGFGGAGAYNLSGTGTLSTSNLSVIGDGGNATFTQSGGTHNAHNLIVGGASTGQYNLQGGSLTVTGGAFVGLGGAGTINHTGGTHTITGADGLQIGLNYVGPGGTYNISGTGVLNTSASAHLSVGYAKSGTLNVTAGGTVNAGDLFYIGEIAPGNGTVSVTGAGASITATGRTYVGGDGPGTLTIESDGVVNSNGGASIAVNSTGTATINSGGTWNASDAYVGGDVGAGGETGVVNINTGGTMTVTGAMKVWNSGAAAPGGTRVNLNGGTLTVGTLELPNFSRFEFASGTLNLTGPGISSITKLSIGTTGSGTVNQTAGATNVGTGNVIVGAGGVGTGTYSLSGGSLAANGIFVGDDSTGTFVHTGGTSTSTFLQIGNHSGGGPHTAGSYTLSDSGVLNTTFFHVAISNVPSSFTQNGGTHNAINVNVGTSGPGTYTLNAGILSATGGFEIGIGSPNGAGTGSFIQTGGSMSVTGTDSLDLGWQAGSSGTYNLSGTGVVSVATTEVIGRSGIGSFTQSGGTNNAATLYLARNSGSTGQYTLQGGSLTVAGTEVVGYDGSGTFTHTAGTNTITGANNLYIGYGSGGTGNYLLSGGTLSTDNFSIVGYSGAGSFSQTGGTHTTAGAIIGHFSGGSGTYALSGTGVLTTTNTEIGQSAGSSSFIQSGGTHNSQLLLVGVNSSSTGGYTLNSGAINTANLVVGYFGIGTFTHSGGLNQVTGGNSFMLASQSGSTGTYGLSGTGQLNVSGNAYVGGSDTADGGTGTLNISGGTATVTGQLKVLNTGDPAPTGTRVNLTGGTLKVGSLDTDGNPDRFNWIGGTLEIPALVLDSTVNAPLGASLNIGENQVLNVRNVLSVGGDAGPVATMTQTGTVVVGNPLDPLGLARLRIGFVSSGSYTLNGGSLTVYGQEGFVGAGAGSFIQTGGVHFAQSIQLSAGGTGTYDLQGGSLTTGHLNVADYGTGTFTQSGGTVTIDGTRRPAEMVIGTAPAEASMGTYTLTGTGSLTVNGPVYAGGYSEGPSGVGILNIQGGDATVTGVLKVWNTGDDAPAGSRLNLSGGTLSVGSIDTDSNADRFNWIGGTLNVTGAGGLNVSPAAIARVSVPAAGTLNVTNAISVGSGGTLTVAGAMSAASLSVTSGGTLDFAHAGAFTWPGVISGNGTINKTGAGVLTITSDWTHTGTTNLNAGTIKLVSPGGLGNQTILNIASGATYDQNGGGDIIESMNGSGSAVNVGSLFLGASGSSSSFSGSITGGPSSRIVVLGSDAKITLTGTTTLGQIMINTGRVTQAAGSMNVNNISVAGVFGGNFQWAGGTLNASSVSLTANGLMKLAPSGDKVLTINTVSIADGSKLDLTDNAMIVKSSNLATIQGLIASAVGENLTWDGPGISSSAATNDPNGITAIGVASYADYVGSGVTDFQGVTNLDADDVLVRVTYLGDSDLNGDTNLDDFPLFIFGLEDPSAPQTWYYGDYNYSGEVDVDDFPLFIAGLENDPIQLASLTNLIEMSSLSLGEKSTMLGMLASVPEPGSLSMLGVAACGLLARRRKTQQSK